MTSRLAFVALALGLGGCAVRMQPVSAPTAPVRVQILAINDLHGNLQPSADPVHYSTGPNQVASATLGGAAVMAAQLATIRAANPDSITVAAGDLIGASPLESAYFLDEPTIEALTMLGLSVASVGNHEFDKGSSELLRMQRGGCEKYTTRIPCRLEPFKGAGFEYLSANVIRADGTTLFPATAIRQVGPVRIGFIGETLEGTGDIVTPAGVAGLHFADEAETANALVPMLKAAGADAIVLLIHEGGRIQGSYHLQDCDGLSGDILPILDRLDPAITTIISGHTHQAYACEIDRGGAKRLLTSGGKYGYFVTDLHLTFDPSTHELIAQAARNLPIVAGAGQDSKVAALIKRYTDAVAPAAARVVGHLTGPVEASAPNGESPAADLIADAQLAATRDAAHGNADLSFINSGGVRKGLQPKPDGSVTYGDIFAMEPFGNNLVVKTLTGTQLKLLLEHQFDADGSFRPSVLIPSANFRFDYDSSRPEGQRIVSMSLDGKPIDPAASYRVTVNNFLASGGDGYTVLVDGADPFDAGLDLDALEAWLATNPPVPTGGRIRDLTPQS
jgi:5'-nucleotidase